MLKLMPQMIRCLIATVQLLLLTAFIERTLSDRYAEYRIRIDKKNR
jgi:hypothetical protein